MEPLSNHVPGIEAAEDRVQHSERLHIQGTGICSLATPHRLLRLRQLPHLSGRHALRSMGLGSGLKSCDSATIAHCQSEVSLNQSHHAHVHEAVATYGLSDLCL